MRVTYGKTAYITAGASLIDQIDSNLSIYANGDNIVCVDLENVKEYIEENQSGDLANTLTDIIGTLEDGVGDLVFVN